MGRSMETSDVREYVTHSGTVRISGQTSPRAAASCALQLLKAETWPLEFLFIGANAGQQATKAMAFLAFIHDRQYSDSEIAFRPSAYWVMSTDRSNNDAPVKRLATVWKVVLVQKAQVHEKVS